MENYGPQTPEGQAIFAQKYAQSGESYRDACNRLAQALSDSPAHYHEAREILLHQRFLPAGRNWAGIGTSKNVCAHNCFVSGTIADSYVDGPGSIMDRAKEAAATMRMGGGIGYDFSTLRPRGALVKRLQSNATGPVSFMEIFNAVGLNTSSSGHRRGAQMGVLRIDHPDIEEFIAAKQDNTSLTGFNISVGVTDEFMRALVQDRDFELRFNGEVYGTVRAVTLWEKLMRAAWDYAEPGVIFIDRMGQENNLSYCESIAATNPCSEQPLPPYGACLLGSFNLVKYVIRNDAGRWDFDMEAFKADIPPVVRMMDNVNDVARYPLREQRTEALNKRRLGIGVMGLANVIEACGYPYGSDQFLFFLHAILGTLKNTAYAASARLAQEKGAFPLFDKAAYMEAPFIKGLHSNTRDLIAEYGLRNSHLTSFAPTGTIAQMADNVSGGIEPTFERRAIRPVIFPDGTREMEVVDYGIRAFGTNPKTSGECSADDHVKVLCATQRHSDSAVSKTCNVDGSMAWDAFKDIYMMAYHWGAKSCSVFNKDGKRFGLLRAAEPPAEDASCASGTCGL
jgi:ribonucleoside-diphosphate reductase alpha chain